MGTKELCQSLDVELLIICCVLSTSGRVCDKRKPSSSSLLRRRLRNGKADFSKPMDKARYLLNNEQLIQQLADSYPVRRAAQLTAYMFHRGKELGEEGIEKLRESDTVQQAKQDVRQTSQRASRFGSTLMKELEEGFKDMNEKMKKRG